MASYNNPPLVVHIIYALKAGGLENGLVNIINRMPTERYRHAIICLTEADEFANRITVPGVEIIQLHKKPGHDFGLYWRVWKTLRILKPSIVHTRNLTSIEMQIIAALLPGVKRVHGEHGRDIGDLDGSNRKFILLRKVMRFFVQHYIAVSKEIENWLIKTIGITPEKVTQIYNGVDAEKFSYSNIVDRKQVLPDKNKNFFVIGTVGRLAEVKNQQFLVKTYARLIERRKDLSDNTRLLLVGDGPNRKALETLIKEFQIEENVWLAGDRNDVPELLRSMDIFVLPSLAEGISNTVLEALASGLPVIATDTGGTPELIVNKENGLLVPVNDIEALESALTQLLEEPDLASRLATSGTQMVQRIFNWDKTVANYLSVYDTLLDHRAKVSACS